MTPATSASKAPAGTHFDVIVVGGGPAGAVMAWTLAQRGVNVAVVERATFPREKVCGDFVEPGGLRILEAMGSREIFEASPNHPITHIRAVIDTHIVYRDRIQYYQAEHGLVPYGCIVPRHELDAHLLDRARDASASVYEGCGVTGVTREGQTMRVDVRSDGRQQQLTAHLVVGADGTESIVARSAGLTQTDRRYISISKRGYVKGVSVTPGESVIWFDQDISPGYGWLFPMSDGRANVGVGILSESCHRFGLSVPKLFDTFVEKLRKHHLGCRGLRLDGRPRGGIVKTYGGIGPNHFDGGLLIGDAGSFVDPMTGEGITQGMESALIASSTVIAALEEGRNDAAFLARYERDFHRYFDPSMRYLDLLSTLLRNRHLTEFSLRAVTRGFEEATADPSFARVAGSSFGGLAVKPLPILGQVVMKLAGYIAEGNAQMFRDVLRGRLQPSGWLLDFGAWQRGVQRSLLEDPAWHASWTIEVMKKAVGLQAAMWKPGNPRIRGFSNEVIQ